MKKIIIALLISLSICASSNWESQILAFEKHDQDYGYKTQKSLFIGSSSIRMWNTDKHFPMNYTLNRGFGGSEVSHILNYYERILKKYQPKLIVLYSGENDLGHKEPLAVYDDFKTLINKIIADFPSVQITWILIKKSPARENLNDKIDKLNALIIQNYNSVKNIKLLDINKLLNLDSYSDLYFREDKLHFNERAYKRISKKVKRIHPLP